MGIDWLGRQEGMHDGCACGKKELDGIRCKLGASHKSVAMMVAGGTWISASSAPSTAVPASSLPWTKQPEPFPSNGQTKMPWEL
jgi:hypothetical protein